jgi:hypothetical protein
MLMLTGSPAVSVGAQDAEATAVPSDEADQATTDDVLAFVDEAVERFNAGEGALAFDANLLQPTTAPIRVDEVRDVRVHEDDTLSVEVSYTGWITERTYYTERWYLSATGDGDVPYLVSAIEPTAPRLPADAATAEVAVVLADDGLTISETEVPAAEFLRYTVENTSDQTSLTTGLYVLPDGLSAAEAQAGLIEDTREGVFDSLEYVGPTPVRQSDSFEFAFDVRPGMTLFIQQFTVDDNFQNAVPLEGEEFATTLTIESADA